MTYSSEQIAEQLSLGEDSQWEFKQVVFKGDRPESPDRGDWADEMAAFANTNGGVLLCGVSDRGEVQGLSGGRMEMLVRIVEILGRSCLLEHRSRARSGKS